MDIKLVRQLQEANIFTPVPEEEVAPRRRAVELKHHSPEVIAAVDKVMVNPELVAKAKAWHQKWIKSNEFYLSWTDVFNPNPSDREIMLMLAEDSDIHSYEEFVEALNNS